MKFAAVATLFASLLSIATAGNSLEALMVETNETVIETDFSTPSKKLDRDLYTMRQATRWEIIDGVLSGLPSSAETQAARAHHKGLEPRLSVPVTPAESATRFSIRFLEGEETAIVPFVEFGHHVIRLRFSLTEGVSLLADYESMKVAEDRTYLYEPGKWIHLFAELKGDEFVIQIQDGPTLYAKHPVISRPAPSGGNGLGVAGPTGGKVEIDDLTIWSVKENAQTSWKETKTEFPAFEPVQVREKPVKG
ncbi:MAG: hypothetical protein P1U68_02340 [Verrucomicrobiales bacterium]|nr:hypothetical protein [Verrucomicrobiales bacterium]